MMGIPDDIRLAGALLRHGRRHGRRNGYLISRICVTILVGKEEGRQEGWAEYLWDFLVLLFFYGVFIRPVAAWVLFLLFLLLR